MRHLQSTLRCPQRGFTAEKLKVTLGKEYAPSVALQQLWLYTDEYVYFTVDLDVATDLLCWVKSEAARCASASVDGAPFELELLQLEFVKDSASPLP